VALRPRVFILPALALLATAPADAAQGGADLSADVDRLADRWSASGAKIERLGPIFLERGREKTLTLAKSTGVGDEAEDGCLLVALVGVRTAEFNVALGDARAEPEQAGAEPDAKEPLLPPGHPKLPGDERAHSVEGALTLVRCGAARAEIRHVAIEMSSVRGTIEILVARSARPLGALREILPERATGPVAPRGSPRGPIEPGPLAERRTRAERRARAEGADAVVGATMRASVVGTGEFELKLGEGCHRLELMAEVPEQVPRRATDVDAEARESSSGKLFARDRADVPDARLDFCLGEATLVSIPFTGAAGAVTVALAAAKWNLSPYVPVRWGSRARAGIAEAIRRRHAPAPMGAPIVESLGVQGVTEVPIEVEPGHCYLAALGVIRGEPRALRLLARIGDETPHDDVVERPEGAAVAFCADTEDRALVAVDARGNSPWWALAVWEMGTVSP